MIKLLLLIDVGLCFTAVILAGFLLHKLTLLRKEIYLMNQARIDDLTEQLKNSNQGIVEVVKSESEQVKQAIADNTIDTSELEKAIAANNELKDLVAGIYTPTTEPTSTTESDTTEPTNVPASTEPSTEVPAETNVTELTDVDTAPTEELPAETTSDNSEVVEDTEAITR
jgi:uncharacterized protein YkvS